MRGGRSGVWACRSSLFNQFEALNRYVALHNLPVYIVNVGVKQRPRGADCENGVGLMSAAGP